MKQKSWLLKERYVVDDLESKYYNTQLNGKDTRIMIVHGKIKIIQLIAKILYNNLKIAIRVCGQGQPKKPIIYIKGLAMQDKPLLKMIMYDFVLYFYF